MERGMPFLEVIDGELESASGMADTGEGKAKGRWLEVVAVSWRPPPD